MTRPGPKTLALLLGLALLALPGEPVRGYMSTRVPEGASNPAVVGKPVRWNLNNPASLPNVANKRIRYEIDAAGCADRAGFTGPVDEFAAIQNSFSRWRSIEASELDFEFAGLIADGVTNASDNRNIIRFLGSGVTAGVFAATIVTFSTSTGEITDADMEINDRDFTWDTAGENPITGPIGRAVIENIITHEIGHIAGLDHPQNAQATLFFASGSGMINQSTLEHDDIAPIIADYPRGGFARPDLGKVSGLVRSGGVGAFGAGVVLVDMATGRNVIGHVTEKPPVGALGSYIIRGVPPGNYIAMAVPLDPARLGAFYSGALTDFFPIVRGVDAGVVGTPTIVRVAPGADITGVDFDLPPGNTHPFTSDDTAAMANLIATGEVAVSRITPATDSDWFKFNTTGAARVTARVLSDTFGLSLNPILTLYDTDGSTPLASPQFGHPAYMPSANDRDGEAFDINGVDYDAEIVHDLPAAGTYFLRVQSRLGATTGPYLLTLEIEGENVQPDPVASTITSSLPGLAAASAETTSISVMPRNVFGKSLDAPLVFTVELLDLTGGGSTVLGTLTAQSAPFVFTVGAQTSPGVRLYGARVDGVTLDVSVLVSHYGTLSATSSRVRFTQTSLSANGYDEGLVLVELFDTALNPWLGQATSVRVSTTVGMLDNGTTTGTSDIAASFYAARRCWVLKLRAPLEPGTAQLTAVVGTPGTPLGGTISVPLLKRAVVATSPPPSDNQDRDRGGGGCVAQANSLNIVGLAAVIGGLMTLWRRRRVAG